MIHSPVRSAFICLVLLAMGSGSALAGNHTAVEGKALLKTNCARCHSIETRGESPLQKAPPLRVVYLKYPIDQLESGLAEGMGSRHQGMPQIQFSAEEVSAILDYLGIITGVPPSTRLRFDIPGEAIPP